MSRKPTISRKVQQEIKELNKKLAKKKSNIKHRHGITVDIPRIDPSLPSKQRRQQMNQARSFLNPNNQQYQYVRNDKGVSFSKKEVNELKRTIDRANRVRAKEHKNIMESEYYIEGTPVGKLGDVKFSNLKSMDNFIPLKFDLNWFISNRGFQIFRENKLDAFKGNFIKRQRNQYLENYHSALIEVFGDTSDTKKLWDKIKNMDVNDFYMATLTNDSIDFDFIYHEGEEKDAKLETLLKNWDIILNKEG